MNLFPYIASWSVLAAAVVGLAVYRKMLSLREDDSIHVLESATTLIPQQVANAQRIDVVEKWGKILTAVAVATGLVLAGFYFWNVWQNGTMVH